jgi:hypothetical protein
MNYAAIAAAMQAEIDNPLKLYMPNSPGAFVRDRLLKDMYWEEAIWFWVHYCNRFFGEPGLDNLYAKLEELTAKESMPAWGTRGT